MSTAILRTFTALFGKWGFRHHRSKCHENSNSTNSNPRYLDSNRACGMYRMDDAWHTKVHLLVALKAMAPARRAWRVGKIRGKVNGDHWLR